MYYKCDQEDHECLCNHFCQVFIKRNFSILMSLKIAPMESSIFSEKLDNLCIIFIEAQYQILSASFNQQQQINVAVK